MTFMSFDQKISCLENAEQKLKRVMNQSSIPASIEIEHALSSLKLAKLYIRKDEKSAEELQRMRCNHANS